MDELKAIFANKFLVAIVIILVLVLGAAFGMNILVDKTSDRVIEKLQRDYVPGPYAPGIDPDKINPNFWRSQQRPYMPQQSVEQKWQSDWERQRLR
jgi:hypothetical protein